MKLTTTIREFFLRLLLPFQWLFIRLPKPFSVPLVTAVALYFFLLFPLLVNVLIPRVISIPLLSAREFLLSALSSQSGFGFKLVSLLIYFIFLDLILIGSAVMTLLVAIGGVLLSHLLAGQFYMIYRRLRTKPIDPSVPVLPIGRPQSMQNGEGESNPLARYKRIGIILSGGGAKGAYQAGAMQAIYEFLEEHNAHDKVQMIAATSIGSWNALFWLAGLVKSSGGNAGPLEKWWSQVNVQKIILPVTYVPTRQNYLLSNQPWKDGFDAFFSGTAAGKRLLYHVQQPNAEDAIRFYFTHSNIGKAHLAFTTNRSEWDTVTANLPNRRPRPVVAEGSYNVVSCQDDEAHTLKSIRTGVFCSMDIPPLFPYTMIDKDFFEDGGVIDNLPIRFGTEVEQCDLLFILPLNASFERKVDQRSLIRRLARVTEIRQGVLERNSFKMIYLYNELASLRERINELETSAASDQVVQTTNRTSPEPLTNEKTAERALTRTHKVVHVFSICPAEELKINTTEFWKTREAGEAFRFMYEVTRNELKRFTNLVDSNQIRMALVSPVPEVPDNNGAKAESTPNVEDYSDSSKVIFKTAGSVAYYVNYFRDF